MSFNDDLLHSKKACEIPKTFCQSWLEEITAQVTLDEYRLELGLSSSETRLRKTQKTEKLLNSTFNLRTIAVGYFDSRGGTLRLGKFERVIPENALDTDYIQEIHMYLCESIPFGLVLGPEGLEFKKPVEVIVPINCTFFKNETSSIVFKIKKIETYND